MGSLPENRLGPYEIHVLVGAGMGAVYRGIDTRLPGTGSHQVTQAEFSERFERKARPVAALNHPHFCALYAVGENFLAMEYVEGKPLTGPLPVEKVIDYAKQILDAFSARIARASFTAISIPTTSRPPSPFQYMAPEVTGKRASMAPPPRT